MLGATYELDAYNTASESENRIHDDSVAKRFGFHGGLVPGVDVYAYMSRAGLIAYGPAFLEGGCMSARFGKPVYDGEHVEIVSAPTPEGRVSIAVSGPGGQAATGEAWMPSPPPAVPHPSSYAVASMPDLADRPKADGVSLAEGTVLGTIREEVTPELHAAYLADVREAHSYYVENGVVHPGYLLRRANMALKDNVLLGPWIHVGSTVQHHSVLKVGDSLETRSVVTDCYDHKGHGFVEMDVLVLASSGRPVARIAHVAIYEPRQVREG